MYIPIPSNLAPRHYQIDFLKAVHIGKNVCSIIHRRAGKDTISIQAILLRALTRIGTHIYLLPLQTQARQVAWSGMTHLGKRFIDYIPKVLIEYTNDARMEIRLINGSRIIFAGSNNVNSLVGTNFVTIVYSEYSLHSPSVRQYLSPILIENGGIEIIQYTPRGQNHAWELYNEVRENPKYFVQHLGVKDTYKLDGTFVISDEQLLDAKNRGMSDEMIRQEFFVDFNVGNLGAYFTREMADMERDGRICAIVANPNLPLHSVWDLGGTDATAGWLFQIEGNHIHLLHLIQDTGQSLKYFLEQADRIRISLRCQWGNHWMPHDVKQAHQGWEQAESRLMMARKAGWFFQVTPKVNFEDGIEALRYVFPKFRIDKNNCQLGIRALREYCRTFDELKSCFNPKPQHDWTSHITDALRYLSVNYRRLYDTPQAPQKYESSI